MQYQINQNILMAVWLSLKKSKSVSSAETYNPELKLTSIKFLFKCKTSFIRVQNKGTLYDTNHDYDHEPHQAPYDDEEKPQIYKEKHLLELILSM